MGTDDVYIKKKILSEVIKLEEWILDNYMNPT